MKRNRENEERKTLTQLEVRKSARDRVKRKKDLQLYTTRSLYGRQFNRLQFGGSVDAREQGLSSA